MFLILTLNKENLFRNSPPILKYSDSRALGKDMARNHEKRAKCFETFRGFWNVQNTNHYSVFDVGS